MALVGRYVYRHDTGQRHFGSIEEKVIHRYFLLLYFRNFEVYGSMQKKMLSGYSNHGK